MSTSCTQVSWGVVIAGAAAATGAVLLFPAVQEPLAQAFGGIGSALKDAAAYIGKIFTGSNAPQVASEGMSAATKTLLRYAGGAALLGGGVAYMMTHDSSDKQCNGMAQAALSVEEAGFAQREQLKAMQGILKARYAMNSPNYAGAGGPAVG